MAAAGDVGDEAGPGRLATFLVSARWFVVVFWAAAAVLAGFLLPGLSSGSGAAVDDIVPAGAPALRTQERAIELFGVPASSDVLVVQRRPNGLQPGDVARHLAAAASAVRAGRAQDAQLRGVIPLVNAVGSAWHERNTTIVDDVLVDPSVNLQTRSQIGARYAQAVHAEGVTGSAPAQLDQFAEIEDALPWITLGTVLVIALVVTLYFRSLLAPLVTLGTAGLAYVVAVHGLAWASEQFDVGVPREIEPLLVVLLLGLVTDYSVFFMAEARRQMQLGRAPHDAARRAAARVGPSVLAAGTIVAASSCALLVADLAFFRTFGPGLAVCALVVTVVAVTLLPALMAILGRWLFRQGTQPQAPTLSKTARRVASRPVAAVLVLLCVAGLGWAASVARHAQLGVSFVAGLPASSPAHRAAADAARGFVGGIVAPTDIVLEGLGAGSHAGPLERLRQSVGRLPPVAATLGPSVQALLPASRSVPHPLATPSGDAARIVAVFAGDPTSARTISEFRRLRDAMPRLVREAGLPATTRVAYAGETALGQESVDAVSSDFKRIAAVIAAVTLLLLIVLLRALVAPVLLLAASVLGYLAALGLTTLAVRALYGDDQLTYYVPLVGAVLLVALGSDYSVLVAGRIRAESARRDTQEALAVAVPQASRAITLAGLTLAGTFAMLAIVPVRSFRELALLLTIGVLLDTVVVRSVLVPGLISLVGNWAWWPGRPQAALSEAEPAEDPGAHEGERLSAS